MENTNEKITKLTREVKQPRILDPKSDIVFKKIFGEHPQLVKSFLNSILPLPPGRLIETIEYIPSEQTPRIPSMKNTIVDVKCKDQEGRIFIVEMQMLWHSGFDKRLLHGASRAFSQQLKKRDEYSKLCPVYGLAILNEVFEPTIEDWYHHYRLIHGVYPDKVLEGLELVFVELPKFKPQTFKDRKLGILWLRFLNEININSQVISEDFFEDPDISLALEIAQESSYTEAELIAYDYYLDAIYVENTVRTGAFEEGKEEGKIEIAKELISDGMALDKISKITKLSIEFLRQL